MRRLLITTILLSSSAMIAPAFALQADDTMAAWKHSTETERSEFLRQLFGEKDAGSAGLLKCMDETSKTPGHTDLAIGDVAKVCASAGKAEQPV